MLHFNINLTSLAAILWSGMLIIAGSIWVLSSQVRKLADLFEDETRRQARDRVYEAARMPRARSATMAHTRASRRSGSAPIRRVSRSHTPLA